MDRAIVDALDDLLASHSSVPAGASPGADLIPTVESQARAWDALREGGWLVAFWGGFEGGEVDSETLLALMETVGYRLVPVALEDLGGYLVPALVTLSARDENASGWLSELSNGAGRPALVWEPAAKELSGGSGPATRADGWCVPEPTQVYTVWAREHRHSGIRRFVVVDGHVTYEPCEVLDLTRQRLVVEIAAEPHAAPHLELSAEELARIRSFHLLFQSASSVGGAQHVLNRSVEYASARTQFGVPIGSFQALKHQMADVRIDIQLSRDLALEGLRLLASGSDDAHGIAAGARLRSAETYVRAVESAIQWHGAFGFTWEAGLHLFYRRALTDRALMERGPLTELVAQLNVSAR